MAMKKWWKSKTVWANALALAALAVQTQTGFVVQPEVQAGALAGINFLLRLITKEGLT